MASKSEKRENKFLDKMTKVYEKHERRVDNQVSRFYENGYLANILTSSEVDPFNNVPLTVRKESTFVYMSEKEMLDKCLTIRENVKQHEPDNMEINFISGVQRYRCSTHSLDNTLIKVIAMGGKEPVYLQIKKGDVVNSLVFIGGDNCEAFLVTKNENGDDCVIRLFEFHLLSISENSTEREEVGLLTSYSWMTGQVFSEVILGYNLRPVKNLLLSEGLRNKRPESQEPKKFAQ